MKFFAVFLVSFSVVPDLAQAQGGLVSCTGLNCNFCTFVTTIHNAAEFVVGLLVVIAVIMLAVTGVQMAASAGNSNQWGALKDRLTNIIIGFVLILASWTLIDVLMKALVSDATLRDMWSTRIEDLCIGMRVPSETAIDQATGGAITTTNGVTIPAGDPALAGNGLSEAEARAQLAAAGIEIKDGAQLVGVRPHVVNEIVALDAACNCNVLITEATGGTHASGVFSHEEGYKLDLRTFDNPELVSYVSSLPSAGSWSDGTPLYYDANACATYAVESDHIDVQYKTGC